MTKTNFAELLLTLEERFEQNVARHRALAWSSVEARIGAYPEKLRVLQQMEQTGGEPDVIGIDANSGEILFCDCSAESPSGRRSICYDRAGLESRKDNLANDTAIDMACTIGISLLTEEEYRALQQLGEFDKKTSSWIQTPAEIRKLGGALFCDRRYGHVFTYHNGAQSFYSARGFRGMLRI